MPDTVNMIFGRPEIDWVPACSYGWALDYHSTQHLIISKIQMTQSKPVFLIPLTITVTLHHNVQLATGIYIFFQHFCSNTQTIYLYRLYSFLSHFVLLNSRISNSGLEKGCVMLKAPSLKWAPEDCSAVKDFICEQTRCYYYNYGSIPVSSAQG